MAFCFGNFELDQERRQLLRTGEPVPLEPKAYELLSLLLERRPRALSRAQIRDVVWAGTYVSESTLGVVVNAIRQALGDDAREPRFIRTVHGFGYAFCGEARELSAERPESGRADVRAGVEASGSSPSEVKSGGATTSGRMATTRAGRRWIAILSVGIVVLLGVGSLAIRRMRSAGVANLVEPRVVPLTSLPGVEIQPDLSPDGTRVAFVWHGPNRDNFDVYVKDIASGEMVRVTQDPAPDRRPVWSPDGKHLAFLRQQDRGAALFVVSPGSGHEQRLRDLDQPVTFSHQALWWSSVDWSPDGRFLAVTDSAKDSTWGIALVSVETGEKVMLAPTTEPTTVDCFPAFSPDGRRLAFFRGGLQVGVESTLHVQPLSGDTPPRGHGDALVMHGIARGAITWLPSGDELLVGSQRVALNGSPTRPFALPGWSPMHWWEGPQRPSVRGTRLAFDTAGFRSQILRVSLAGATKASPAPFFPSTRGELDPAFAPDGRRVAFTSWRSGDGHLWIGEADGSASRELPLPPGSIHAGSASWSPDGRRLAFDSGIDATHVYIANPEGGTLRPLTSERTSDARPRWSRDGRFIYFASTRGGGDWQLWKARADADDPETDAVQVTRSGGMEAEESADGKYLYYAKRGARGVFRVPLRAWESPEEKVLDLGGEGRWRLTARGILVLDLQSGQPPTIRFHDFATGTTSVFLDVPIAPEWDIIGGTFTVSPDERWALIGTYQLVESDIMLLEGFR